MKKTVKRAALAGLSAALMGPLGAAQAQQQTVPNLAAAAATDPALLGWMVGSPPPPDKTIRFADGSFYKFPQMRWSFSHWSELMPSSDIWRGEGRMAELPRAERSDLDLMTFQPWGSNKTMTWVDALASNYTDAILVLHKGRIVYERYFGVITPHTRHIAMSVTKSVFGTLAETLVVEGKLDPAAPVTQYIPELKDSGYAGVTVRQVMDMTTGIKFSENYADPKAEFWTYVLAGGLSPRPAGYDGPKNFYDYAMQVKKAPGVEPGSTFAYQTVNADVVGWLIRRASGKTVGELLSQRIWSKLSVERSAAMAVDSGGNDFAGGGLQMTLRDMARFGEMIRQGGRFNGQVIVPQAVVDDIRKGGSTEAFAKAGYATLPGWSYRDMWWVSNDDHGVFAARGIHGQTIYVDPKAEMVIVRFASAPVAGNAASDPVMLPAFRMMADELMR